MKAYPLNHLFGCRECILLYPWAFRGYPPDTKDRTGANAMFCRSKCSGYVWPVDARAGVCAAFGEFVARELA